MGELVLANVSAENVCVFSYYDTQEGGEIYTSTVCNDELLSYLEGLKADKFLGSGSWTYKEADPELYCEVDVYKRQIVCSVWRIMIYRFI